MPTELLSMQLLHNIRDVLTHARQHLQYAVNQTMVQAYWQVGRLIVEEEQQGQQRAGYGKQQLEQLSNQLQKEFGRGFDVSNLRHMRLFYKTFPIQDAVRPELSWTHYRVLIRLENTTARDWYMAESIAQSWSARALERQISTLYLSLIHISEPTRPY